MGTFTWAFARTCNFSLLSRTIKDLNSCGPLYAQTRTHMHTRAYTVSHTHIHNTHSHVNTLSLSLSHTHTHTRELQGHFRQEGPMLLFHSVGFELPKLDISNFDQLL